LEVNLSFSKPESGSFWTSQNLKVDKKAYLGVNLSFSKPESGTFLLKRPKSQNFFFSLECKT
jgi:hypothetical protein